MIKTESADELEAVKPQLQKRKKRLRSVKEKIEISVDELEDYCRDCVDWHDVRPILNMVQAVVPRNGPPEIWRAVKRIRHEFKKRIYGAKINTKNLVMKRPYVKGPLNSFKHNNKIELGK